MLDYSDILHSSTDQKAACMVSRLVVAYVTLLALIASGGHARSRVWQGDMLRVASATEPLDSAFAPSQIATAYNFAPLYKEGIDGSGQTIALVEVDGFDATDLQAFDAAYHLPEARVSQSYVGSPGFHTERGGETTMDLEWAHALAPGAGLHVYYVDNYEKVRQGWRSMASALRLAMREGASTVSISLNACGLGPGYRATSRALRQLVAAGITTFVSSGDSGAHPGPATNCGKRIGVAYPTSDPCVISVGGTSLALNPDGTILREVAWSLSGGGRVKRLSRSTWQTAPSIPTDRYRWAPDVAFVGDPLTGISIYYRGSWEQAGGTSVGAPGWSAAWALIQQRARRSGVLVGAGPALLYQLANSTGYDQVFHDITRGGNKHYRASQGWDAVTGLGTPNVAALATGVQRLAAAR